jgi:hypothetical protein
VLTEKTNFLSIFVWGARHGEFLADSNIFKMRSTVNNVLKKVLSINIVKSENSNKIQNQFIV